jgi:8-oxo-dGTP pyrophosphatase MutT (NUDIX family)
MNPFVPKRLSCGVVIFGSRRELLLCHVTGQAHWDLPKGGARADESPHQAALRETREETGLRLDGHTLLDLGRFDFSPKKELHLFALRLPHVDPAALRCESQFTVFGSARRLPEMDDYGWFGFERLPALCTPRLSAVLTGRIDLDALHDSLARQPALAA